MSSTLKKNLHDGMKYEKIFRKLMGLKLISEEEYIGRSVGGCDVKYKGKLFEIKKVNLFQSKSKFRVEFTETELKVMEKFKEKYYLILFVVVDQNLTHFFQIPGKKLHRHRKQFKKSKKKFGITRTTVSYKIFEKILKIKF